MAAAVGAVVNNMRNSSSGDAGMHDESDNEVLLWSAEQLSQWLATKGFPKEANAFLKHSVDGSMIFHLDPADFEQIGIRKVGIRMQIEDLVGTLSSAHIRSESAALKVPSWPAALLQFFTYSWAGTSEGKSGSASKEELTGANFAISIMSALMTSVAYDWFLSVSSDCFCSATTSSVVNGTVTTVPGLCFCSTGYDMEGMALETFFMLSGMSATLFLCATVVCILQIVSINEMSDEDEMLEFFELLDQHETLPGKMVSMGLFTLVLAQFTYSINTVKLGAAHKGGLPSKCMNGIALIVVLYTVYANASMARSVYRAKIEVSQELQAKKQAKDRERDKPSRKTIKDDGRGIALTQMTDGSSSTPDTPGEMRLLM